MMPRELFQTRAFQFCGRVFGQDVDPCFYQASRRGLSARQYLAQTAREERRKRDARRQAESVYPEASCGYCGTTYQHTPRTKPICNSCLSDAGF